MLSKLKKNYSSELLFKNSILFCNLSTFKFIPFKIIYIIGFNNNCNNYNNTFFNSYDLIKNNPIIFDNFNKEVQFKHYFLQLLLSSKHFFLISYIVGNDLNQYHTPLLLEHLITYISKKFFIKGDENFTLKKQSQNVIYHLNNTYKNNFYFKNHLIQNTFTKKINKKWFYEKWSNNKRISNIKKNNSLKKLNLNDLIKFWTNPIRYFCNNTLKLTFQKTNNDNINTENFVISKFVNYKFCNDILTAILCQKNTKKIFELYNKSGYLPHGKFGFAIFSENKKKMANLSKQILKIRRFPISKRINIQIQNCYINEHLSQICKTGLLLWRPKTLNLNDSITLWFKHLLYCLSGGKKNSLMIGLNSSALKYSPISVDSAYYYLSSYITAYLESKHIPMLITQSATKWLLTTFDKKNKKITQNKLQQSKGIHNFMKNWKGTNYIRGEKDNVYIQRIIPQLSKKHITKMCFLTQRWLLPILIHQRKIKIK